MSGTRTGSARQFSELFPESELPLILDALRRGCAGLRKTSEAELENQITTRLYKRLARGQPFRDGLLDIRPQVPVVDLATDDDDIAGQVDLMVTCARGTDVYFAIEAKRLRIRGKNGKVAALADPSFDETLHDLTKRSFTIYHLLIPA